MTKRREAAKEDDGITTLLNNTEFALTMYSSTQNRIPSLRKRWFHMMDEKVLISVLSRSITTISPISTLINSTLMELKSREGYKGVL